MRGQLDNVIGTQQGAEEARAPEAGEQEPPRPPGGKALMRLFQVLERSGFTETAEESLELAVSQDKKREFRAQAVQFTAAPGGEPAGGRLSARSRRAKGSRSTKKSEATRSDAGPADTENVAQMYLEAAERLTPPTPTRPQWRSLGPWTVPNGQTYGSSRVNISGRVSCIVVDPSDPAHVLVGAANGGVWQSRDRGGSWQPCTDYAATLTVGALAFDPSNPSVVYCGTGEANWWHWLGAGILRSTDGGTTWGTLCTIPFVGRGFYDLVVDPTNSQHLLAATNGGLYTSNDGGITWTRRRTAVTWSISMTPGGGASARIFAACADGLWRSTNGGATWSAVTLPGSPGAFDRMAVATAPSNQAVAYVWAAGPPYVGTNQVPTAYLWRRNANRWVAVTPPPGISTGQSWYDWFLGVAPDRDTQVYCGAIDVHRGDLSGGTWTWTNLSSKPAGGDSIHPDQHAIAFEPGQPNTVYVGNDGGLFRSPDRGVTWQHCNNGLVISEFEYLAQDVGTSRWLMGGTQDNGTQRWTGTAIQDHIADGDGGDCGVNRSTPETIFHTYYLMSLERSSSRGDAGSWTWIAPAVPMGEGSLFYPPFECSATTGDTVAMGGDRLYISRNNGTAWTALAFPSPARSSSMHIPNADTVYVGVTDGRIFRTTWNGANWSGLTALTTPRANAYTSDIHVDPNNANRIWVTYSTINGGRIFRSDNGGSTWTDFTAGLPALPINSVEIDSANANRVWVAADLGVYQSQDGGTTWADFSNGLPNMFVGDLIFHPHARVLRVGTRNRGVWEIPVDGWMSQPVCGVQWIGNLAGNQSARWFTFNWPATWHVIWTVMPTNPRPGAPQVSWNVQVERASAEYVTYWINVQNLTPDPLTFEGRFCILSRY
jgi:hypothetical protein